MRRKNRSRIFIKGAARPSLLRGRISAPFPGEKSGSTGRNSYCSWDKKIGGSVSLLIDNLCLIGTETRQDAFG